MKENHNKIKRIVAIHDLCGIGNCSLNVVLPVLVHAGYNVCAFPNSILSAHTGLEHFEVLNTSDFLKNSVKTWSKLNVNADVIYSGFLSESSNVESILSLREQNPAAINIVDPVMGDNGKKYKTYSDKLCNSMKDLIQNSDLITPNMTEACILCDIDYIQNPSDSQIENILKTLHNMGSKNIVLKGAKFIKIQDKTYIVNYVMDDKKNITEVKNLYYPYDIHGCGDLYCSLIIASYLKDENIIKACKTASKYIVDAIEYTVAHPDLKKLGISYEPLLKNWVL